MAEIRTPAMRAALALATLLASSGAAAMGLGGWGGSSSGSTGTTATRRATIARFGGLKAPARICMTDLGNLYVSDPPRGRVVVLDASGTRTGTITGIGRPLGIAAVESAVTTTTTTCTTEWVEDASCVPPTADGSTAADSDEDSDSDSDEDSDGKKKKEHDDEDSDADSDGAADTGSDGASDTGTASTCTGAWVETCVDDTTTETVAIVWVGDEEDGSVRIFEDGVETGRLGGGAGEFGKPNAIAVASDGTVYVVDSSAHQVKVYDSTGASLGSFGSEGSGDGELEFPTDIAIDESAGELYVADFGNQRIAVFDLSGNWVSNISPPNNDSGDPAFFRPSGIGIDPAGNLYVVDAALSAVVVLDSAGGLVDIVGYDAGRYWTGDLAIPVDAVSDGSSLYVTSSGEGLVKVYEVTP